ncbi:P27 family phage terminase small subunit [Listeria booriae]|uniref:P27 family phage terminase small subunit n=2 Tax=Listeria booriae TaxID=1552123 RepID=A0A7X1DPK3_9LIST|nr:P27 family phage terminase small subunit [Listeria booriae]MBC1524805.1 P27 family phage terminase small subunit [Listeria booriae]MBC2048216.1 P27 family phage terminase small subunit [Listeria booriae]MBC2263705.1 P27 family phage terminase small subunit [Listeria booriae]MBC2370540.1 P27 family phage terminase small subunit [Listeria booriae]MBC6134313.1 P27 family phage terminase small subunit [Listeria booriae]
MAFTELLPEKERLKRRKKIEAELKKQLDEKGLNNPIFLDRIDSYLGYWDMEQALIKDINERGFFTEYNNGGGQVGTKKNDSTILLQKYTKQMLDTLQFMGLKPPTDIKKDVGGNDDPNL